MITIIVSEESELMHVPPIAMGVADIVICKDKIIKCRFEVEPINV